MDSYLVLFCFESCPLLCNITTSTNLPLNPWWSSVLLCWPKHKTRIPPSEDVASNFGAVAFCCWAHLMYQPRVRAYCKNMKTSMRKLLPGSWFMSFLVSLEGHVCTKNTLYMFKRCDRPAWLDDQLVQAKLLSLAVKNPIFPDVSKYSFFMLSGCFS